MKRYQSGFWTPVLLLFLLAADLYGAVVFDRYSPYHHVQVSDSWGNRILSFDGSQQSRMSLDDPLKGQFEYTEFLHMPWVWNRELKRVLMLGLGGGSIQRAYQHYYTNTLIETVELDPVVVEVTRDYFQVQETTRHKIVIQDARQYLLRAAGPYDAIFMDAYTQGRYGASVPPHLATQEFFKLANDRLGTNGVLAYNVVGTLRGSGPDMIGAVYRTMKQVFPQVYLFPSGTSWNVVLVATKSGTRWDYARFQQEGTVLMHSGQVKLPTFSLRLRSFRIEPPATASVSPILTDDHAPVERLSSRLAGAPGAGASE